MTDILKIDYWWKAILIIGCLLAAAALVFDIQFIERRYVLGLGIGLILIGIAYWKARKRANKHVGDGILSWDVLVFDTAAKIMRIIGVIISVFFLIRLLIVLAI